MKYRWVRYEAPVMVCVGIDDDGERVVNVVVAEEAEDIHLARSHDGTALVYDERMELLDATDPTAQAALHKAEDRDWPALDAWEGGPDPLRYPGLYNPVDDTDNPYDGEDLDPLDLDKNTPSAQAA